VEFEKVRDVILAQLGEGNAKLTAESITPQTTFLEDLGADSLDIFQIITELEEIYNMEFNDEAAENIKTVGDAAEYIHQALVS